MRNFGQQPKETMMHFRRTLTGLLAVALALIVSLPIAAQPRAGIYNAADYAYGVVSTVPGLRVGVGGAAGAVTLTVEFGYTTAADGTSFNPLNVNAPITLGNNTTRETVTPTAVSCSTPNINNTCTVTATFTYAHGRGETISSGTLGLQEAINAAVAGGYGGEVIVSPRWNQLGGTSAMIEAAAAYSSVYIHDTRPGRLQEYYSMQPTTLTSIAAPAVLDAAKVTWTGTTGTWTAAQHFLCVTYVDPLGGEGPCSPTYDVTPAANTILHIASPVASTGAVGWRAYAGASYNAAYLLPITSTNCTLTGLQSVVKACAIGSAGTWSAIFANTAMLRPNAQSPTVNLNLPMPQGHTTFAYKPTGHIPVPFQTDFGPFPAFGNLTAGQIAVLGSVHLPTTYLNQIGRTIRVSGKIISTEINTATLPTLGLYLGWVGGTTAGAPVAVCAFSGPAVGSTVAYNLPFSCTMTTNAASGTATATIMASGSAAVQVPTGAAIGQAYTELGTAAVGSLGLFAQNTLYVKYTSTTNATNAPQLLDLHVETLQ